MGKGSSPYIEEEKSINGDQAIKHEPVEAERNSTRACKTRKGNLPAVSAGDITRSGLTGREIVECLTERKPGLLDEEDIESLALKLSKATSRIASEIPKGKVDPPIRVQKSAKGPWSSVALIEKGTGGRPSADGEHKGNLYGLIRDIDASGEVNDDN